jgi:LruC domain-containing protein
MTVGICDRPRIRRNSLKDARLTETEMRESNSFICGTLVAFLSLSSPLTTQAYTVSANNKIIWTYLGQTASSPSPYTAIGLPNHADYTAQYPINLPVPSLPTDLNSRIALMLPEKVDIRKNSQLALSSDDQTNIKLGGDAAIWVTFLNEGAGFTNSVGFFTYDLKNPPLKPTDVSSEQIIIPNASIPPLTQASVQGSTVYLGTFPAGTGVGFFVAANGWSSTGRTLAGQTVPGTREAIDKNWIFYSIKGLNAEPATNNLNQHTILLNDQTLTGTDGRAYQRLILGFEDYLRTSSSDHDFNDVTLAIHVSPSVSISNLSSLAPIVTSTTDSDTDADGVRDSVDEFPTDPGRAFSRWYPSSGTFGTLAFEDMWPMQGDYDLNDMIVRYRSREILNPSRDVSAVELDLRVDARGGAYRSGFAVSLPGVQASNIKSATLTDPNGVTNPISPLAGQSNAIFEIFQSAYEYLPASNGDSLCDIYFNTGMGCPIKAKASFKLNLTLASPQNGFPTPPYDPFIFRTQERKVGDTYVQGPIYGVEVHLPGKQPSNRADLSLLGQEQDASVRGSSKTYMTANGLPWALDIPWEWDYPAEFIDISRPYPNIVPWAQSGGVSNTGWYLTPSNMNLTFRNGR